MAAESLIQGINEKALLTKSETLDFYNEALSNLSQLLAGKGNPVPGS